MDITVTLEKDKITSQSKGKIIPYVKGLFFELNGCSMEGYEIHMGQNSFGKDAIPVGYLTRRGAETARVLDMACNPEGNVFGTYLHGIFDNGGFMRGLVNYIRDKKGLGDITSGRVSFTDFKEREYDRLADIVRNHTDMELFYKILRGSET